MALNDLKGTIVSQTILAALNEASVAQSLIGSEIAGDEVVGRGKTLRVAKASTVSVADYDGETPLAPEALTPAYVDLVLNKAKAASFSLDDVDAATVSVEMLAPHAIEAGRAIAGQIDEDIIADLVTNAAGANDVTGKTISSSYTAYTMLTDMAVKLDEANVPADGRWVIVTPAFAAQLALDPRLNRATAQGDAVAAAGFVGEAAGFRVVKTNRIAAGTVVAGHGVAAAFAQAVSKAETVRSGDFFADVFRTLAVYGSKVVRASALSKGTWELD